MNIDVLSQKEKKVIIDYFINDLSLKKVIQKMKLNLSKEGLRYKIEQILYKFFSYYENFIDLLDVLKLISNNKIFIFHNKKIESDLKQNYSDKTYLDLYLKYRLCFYFLKKINSNIIIDYSKKQKFIIVYFIELKPVVNEIINNKNFKTYEEFKNLIYQYSKTDEEDIKELYLHIYKPNLPKIVKYLKDNKIDINKSNLKNYLKKCLIKRSEHRINLIVKKYSN